MKMKNNTRMIVTFSISLAFGLLFSFIAILARISYKKFIKTAIPVSAEITDIEFRRTGRGHTNGKAYVEYKVNGKKYEAPLNYYSSSMREGDMITIYCQPDNPRNIRVKFDLLPLILGIMGAVFTVTGIGGFIGTFRKSKLKKNLLVNGQRVIATVSEINLDTSYAVNGRHPYRIICTYTDPQNVVHFFKSEAIWYDPSEVMTGNMVPVYVNPDNYNKYYVKIDEILTRQVEFH